MSISLTDSVELIDGVGYTFATDVWSLGITVLALCEGAPPHAREANPRKAITLISNMPAPTLSTTLRQEASVHLVEFLSQCLQKEPTQRASVRALLDHPWVRDVVRSLRKNGPSSPVLLELIALRAVWKEALEEQQCKQRAMQQRLEQRLEQERKGEEIHRRANEKLRVRRVLTLELLRRQRLAEEQAQEEEKRRVQCCQDMQQEEVATREFLQLEEIHRQECMRRRETEERLQMYMEDELSYMERRQLKVEDLYHADWVCKQSEYLGQWNPRYFTVKEGVLRYFVDNAGGHRAAERGIFVLSPNTTVAVVSARCLCVSDEKLDGSSWSVTIRCASEDDMHMWIRYIERNILFISERAILTPFQIERATAYYREGWIEKMSEYLGVWNNRYFVVDRGVIVYFDSEKDADRIVERGRFVLSVASDLTDESTDDREVPPCCLYVHDANPFTGSNWSLLLKFPSAEDRDAWRTCLELHMSLFV